MHRRASAQERSRPQAAVHFLSGRLNGCGLELPVSLLILSYWSMTVLNVTANKRGTPTAARLKFASQSMLAADRPLARECARSTAIAQRARMLNSFFHNSHNNLANAVDSGGISLCVAGRRR